MVTIDQAAAQIRKGVSLQLHPLCGGMPPDIAWHYLERASVATARARGEGLNDQTAPQRM